MRGKEYIHDNLLITTDIHVQCDIIIYRSYTSRTEFINICIFIHYASKYIYGYVRSPTHKLY